MRVDYPGADFVCRGVSPLDFILAGSWVRDHSGEATPAVEVGMQMEASEGAVKTMNGDSTPWPDCHRRVGVSLCMVE